MPAINNKPNEINKQDKETNTQYQDKQAMGADQKLFEARYQKVCNDENDDGQENKNEKLGPFIKSLNMGPNPAVFCQPIHTFNR